jgi:hypothetical protein
VSKEVRRNPFSGKIGSVRDCTPCGTTNRMGRTEPRQPPATRADEDRFALVTGEAAFVAQALQRSRQIGCKRNQTFFSAFPAKQHVRRPIQPQISSVDADRLGHASAGASQEEQERIISASQRSLLIRRIQQGLDSGR